MCTTGGIMSTTTKPPSEPTAREQLSRQLRAELLADVLWITGITAAQATAMEGERWLTLSDATARLLPGDFAPDYTPSPETRRLVLAKLTRREMLKKELTR